MDEQSNQQAQATLQSMIKRRLCSGPAPLTDRQAVWWTRTSKNGRAENTRLRAAAVRIIGRLDTGILRSSIERVIERHESLRTRVVVEGGALVQQVGIGNALNLDVIDLTHLSAAQGEREAQSSAKQFFDQRVDLSVGPLFQHRLLRISNQSHVLLLGLEHVVGDGTSCNILRREIWAAYTQMSSGESLSLPGLPIQLSDYAVWLQQTHDLRKRLHEKYWLTRMADTPKIDLPLVTDSADSTTPTKATITIPLGKSISTALREFSQREKTLFPLVIHAIYILSLSRWCCQDDIVTLFVSHGRHRRPELQNVIGFLAGALYFRTQIVHSESLSDLVARVRSEFFSAISHQMFTAPFPEQCNLGLLFNWGGLSTYSAKWSIDKQRLAIPNLRVQPFYFRENLDGGAFFPFFSDTPSGVAMTVHYCPELLPHSSLQRLARNMRVFGYHLAQNASTKIGSLPSIV